MVFVAICSVLSLIPVTLTRRLHPALQVPAPLALRYYVARVPLSLTVLFLAGTPTGAFYGLQHGMDTHQVVGCSWRCPSRPAWRASGRWAGSPIT